MKWSKNAGGGYHARDARGVLCMIERGTHSSGERGFILYREGEGRAGFYATLKQAKNAAAARENPVESARIVWHQAREGGERKTGESPDGGFYTIQKGVKGWELYVAYPLANKPRAKRLGIYRTVMLAITEANEHAAGRPVRPNPVNAGSEIHQAKGLRAGFRATAGVAAAKQAGRVKHVKIRPTDDVQLTIGKVLAIEYAICDDKGRALPGQVFRHEFTGKSCPMLTTGHDGRQLYFVGGSYRFKTDGINDVK